MFRGGCGFVSRCFIGRAVGQPNGTSGRTYGLQAARCPRLDRCLKYPYGARDHAESRLGGALLSRLKIVGFKSLKEVEVSLPRLSVLFGPNAAGKSNFLDAIQALSRLATSRTISEALGAPLRGNPLEMFSFPEGGLPELIGRKDAQFSFEADLTVKNTVYRYSVTVQVEPRSGSLSVSNEYLSSLHRRTGEPMGTPRVETVGESIYIRSRQGRPRKEGLYQNHTKLSDTRLVASEFSAINICRSELANWRVYYLDPRVSMRVPQPPSEVDDVGILGEHISPFLFRLKTRNMAAFKQVRRTLNALIPSVEDIRVELDERRGLLDIVLVQHGKEFSSRLVSEGTLRVLALCCIAVNPWAGSLVALEEPENGVHPSRIQLVAKLINSMATTSRQVIVTSHSPLFCSTIHAESPSKRDSRREIALLSARTAGDDTKIENVHISGDLFRAHEIGDRMDDPLEQRALNRLLMSDEYSSRNHAR